MANEKTPEDLFERGDRVDVKGMSLEVRHATEYELILVPVKMAAKKTKAA